MRRTRPVLVSALVCALAAPLIVAAAPNVLAQTATTSAASAAPSASVAPDEAAKAKEEAKEHFLKGVSLMQEEQWDAALVEFKASLQMFPTRNARKNAAVCLRQLGRFADALDEYEMLLRDFSSSLPPADAEQVNKAIADLKNVTGAIVIDTTVEGAQVIIDSRARGTTPLGPVRVGQGTHTVRVLKEGYVPFETTQAVLGKQTVTVTAKLEVLARSGTLQIIEETGAEAEIIVDGAPKGKMGKAPYQEKIGPGAHWVALRGQGTLGTEPAPVNVQVDQTVTLRLKLIDLGGEARLETNPVGAAIVLDGVPVGQGTWEGRLRVGTHKLDVASDGYFKYSKTFEVKAGGKTAFRASLDRDENSPFWSSGRARPISVSLFGSGLYALFGLQSQYERSCTSGATCYDRTLGRGVMGGARGGYEVAPGLSIELEGGYLYMSSALSRKTTLLAEQNARVDVDIRDEWTLRGFMAGLGLSYRFIRKPIVVYGAFAGGVVLGAKAFDYRSGSEPCFDTKGNVDPSASNCSTAFVDGPGGTKVPRPMAPWSATAIKTIPWFAPELRIALPIGDSLQIGMSLGVLIGIADNRPVLVQTPSVSAADRAAKIDRATLNGKPVGLVPQNGPGVQPESAVGTFTVPRASLFVRLAF